MKTNNTLEIRTGITELGMDDLQEIAGGRDLYPEEFDEIMKAYEMIETLCNYLIESGNKDSADAIFNEFYETLDKYLVYTKGLPDGSKKVSFFNTFNYI